jgi:bacteriorhodopsin
VGSARRNVTATASNTSAHGAGAGGLTYLNVTCADKEQSALWCAQLERKRNLTAMEAEVCAEVMGGKPNVITVVVNTEIVVINNVTQVVQIGGDNTTSTLLQREINAFLSSFASTGLLYGSNRGIGQFANIVLWLGFFIFCLFSIILEWISARKRRGKMPIFMLTLQSALTTLGYLTMAFGHGRLHEEQVVFRSARKEQGLSTTLNVTGNSTTNEYYIAAEILLVPSVPPFFYVRYLTWMVTTPTVLYLLCDFVEHVEPFFAPLALVDVGMLICGVAAAEARGSSEHVPIKTWIFFAIGVLLFVALAAQLLGPLRKAAHGVDRLAGYTRLLNFVLCSWSAYPVLWFLSDKGLGLMSTDQEVCLYVLADVVSKIGFSSLLLYQLNIQTRPARNHMSSAPAAPLGGGGGGKGALATARDAAMQEARGGMTLEMRKGGGALLYMCSLCKVFALCRRCSREARGRHDVENAERCLYV